MKQQITLITLLAGLLASTVMAASDPKAIELLERVDNLYQQENSHAVMTMEIVTPDFERSMSMESWSIGLDYSLVRVLEPKKERGVSTLKRENDMWNYLPKIRKVIKVPPSMMMGSWMGSDFTNDDLMREGSWVDEFDVTLSEDDTLYTLDLVAKPDTVTVWGAMQIIIDKTNLMPLKQVYFDEDGSAMREMIFSDIKTFGEVTLPTVMELRPLNKPENRTRVIYESMDFDVDIDEDFFSLQNLKKTR
ncbi:outer membrane lipoprotein-sorting protein [Reinekea sp. G2M2-21]|uniref:outer membrane lipoprotein-sorting protein n=1 Tax=Reinekea sp. G2M2-21 TaxID=2788942 RepID=UPI00351C4F12